MLEKFPRIVQKKVEFMRETLLYANAGQGVF